MSSFTYNDHRTNIQRAYRGALETATADRVLLPDAFLKQDNQPSDASPELSAVYDQYCWASHSLKARFWLQAAIVFNILLIVFDYLVSPALLIPALIIRGPIVTTIFLILYMLWGRQNARWVQGLTLVVASVTIMLEAGVLGALGGVALYERYLTAGLFTVATAVLFFPIEFRWTISTVAIAAVLHGFLLDIGPVADPITAMAISCFYFSAIVSFASTRKATLRSQWKNFKSKIRELRHQESLTQLNAELKLVANLDPLTGLQNRRSAFKEIERIWSNGAAGRGSIAFLMLDIDDFKKLNDTFGHGAGDECIKSVADAITHSVRGGDIVSRFGGEEYLVVLNCAGVDSALAVAERIRKTVEALRLDVLGSDPNRRVTVSIGLAMREGNQTPQMLINRADEALYLAKNNGKNQTMVSSQPASSGTAS